MKFTQLFILCFLVLGCSPKEDKSALKVMTYNIRLNTPNDGDNAWPNRKEFLSSQVLFLGPDVLGVQEALPDQIKDLNKLLPNYKFIGHGRDGGDSGEYSAIYYNTKRVTLEENGTFWLSTTPEKLSKDWDAALPRICTYGLFTRQDTKTKFWVFNTHFDHVGGNARNQSVKLILEQIASKNTNKYPVVLMGDLNVEPQSEVITLATKAMLDTKSVAKVTFGPTGTFTGFRYNEPVNRRIDYILVSKDSSIEVEKYAVLSSAVDFKFPSDHFPVYVELSFK